MTPLEALAAAIRDSPAIASKRDLALLTRLGSPLDGDDGAAIAHGDEYLIVCGEAIHPEFVRSNPHAAGAAAVITNVSDVRAMGGRPVGLVDMLVSPDRAHAEAVLDGLACATCGRLDDSGVLRLAAAGESTALWDLNVEPLTHLNPAGST